MITFGMQLTRVALTMNAIQLYLVCAFRGVIGNVTLMYIAAALLEPF